MTLSLTLSDLAHRYPMDICNRGIYLYNDSRVGDLYFDEGMIESEVEGDRDSYTVRISLNNRGAPVDTDCSCSYCFQAGHCSHIVALLVKLINEKVQLVALSGRRPGAEIVRKGEIEDFPVSPLERGLVKKSSLLLSFADGPVSDLSSNHAGNPSFPGGAGRWKGAFCLRKRGDEWRIGPVLLYIKKDGTSGRIDRNFSLARVTEAMTDEEERLFRFMELAAYGPEEGIPFERIAGQILEDRDSLTLINGEGNPYRFQAAHSLALSFDPVVYPEEGQGEEQLRFLPEFSFPAEASELYHPLENTLALHRDQLYIADSAGGSIYRYDLKNKAPLMEFFLFRRENPLNMGEIRALRQEYAECFDDQLQWAFEPWEIQRLQIVPVTVLTGYDTGWGGCAFKLSFDYGERGTYPFNRGPAGFRKTRPIRCRGEEDDRTLVLFRRDHDLERDIHRWLENWFLTSFGTPPYDSPMNRFKGSHEFLAEKSLNDLLVAHGDSLLDRGIELRLEKQKGKIRKSAGGNWHFKGTAYKEWLSFSLDTGDGEEVDLEDFLKGGFLRTGTDLVVISSGEKEKLKALLEKGELKQGKLILSPYDHEALDLMEESFGLPEDEEILRARERADRLKSFETIEDTPLPAGFRGTLRPYQKGGYDWLHFLGRYGLGGCLADDMGLGKTVQTLCLLQSLKEKGNIGQVLLLAPVTTLMNWKGEAERFTPSLSVVVHTGGRRGRSREELSHADLVLSSYQTFLRDADWLREGHWHYLILDEAQAVKNWQSKTRLAVKKINADNRLALTGTPVENGMIELWSLFDLLEPGLLGTRDMFRRRYQIPMERDGDKSRADELRKRVAPLMLRRKKEEVLSDLPEKEENLVWLEMGEEQRKVYDKARRGFLALIEDTLKKKELSQAAMEILTALLRLRQLAVAPVLADSAYDEIPSCKMDYLDYFLDDLLAEDHRVLVFSQFVSALALVRERLDRRGADYAYLDGSTKNREEEIARFQSEGGPSVFLISLKAGGVGINLTNADYVVLLDPWWNPAVENQAVDRAHRIGQKRSVMVYKPIVRDTVEEKVLELQKGKKDLAAELISEDKGFLKSLSPEEVASLFQ